MRECYASHIHVDETLSFEEAPKLPVVGEPEDVRTWRKAVGRSRAGLSDRLEEHAEHAHLRRRVPGGQRQPAPGREDPYALGDRQLRTAEVGEPEVADHRVEGAVLERERLSVRPPELDTRMLGASPGDHRLGDVHTPYPRPQASCLRGHVPRTGGHVEHARARTHPGAIQERSDQPARNGTEEPRVPFHALFPRTRLELIERVKIDVHLIARRCVLPCRTP